MTIPSFDERLKMTDEQLVELLETEARKIIDNSDNPKPLEHLYTRIRMKSRACSNQTKRMVIASQALNEKIPEFTEAVNNLATIANNLGPDVQKLSK